MSISVGMRSLAITFPGGLKTNAYWEQHYPDIVERARGKANIWSHPGTEPAEVQSAFDVEMAKYLEDPFRGSKERRVLLPEENALTIETRAADLAIRASGIRPEEIGLVISSSFFTDMLGIGNASFIAGNLGLSCAAWNLETACSAALASFETACALVRAGQYKNVLCVISCTYSRSFEDENSMSWLSGDGAGAFLVSEVPSGEGLLSSALMHSAETKDAFLVDAMVDRQRYGTTVRVRSSANASRLIRQVSEPYLLKTVQEALDKAGIGLSEIKWLVVNTPTAWYSAFCARALGFDPARCLSTFERYANCGPALMPVNLYTTAVEAPLKRGDLVLIHTVGSASSSGAAVVRWGDVALGPLPDPPQKTF